MANVEILDSKNKKICKSADYNYIFNKQTGFFARWGKTPDEDPEVAPGPEILDLEISSGDCLGKCKHCYKGNGSGAAKHMSFESFKKIFDKLPKTITQIAFGLTDVQSNPDTFKMFEYCRENGVIPNYTCHGLDITDEVVQKTAKLCGAVAVSVYNKNKSYDAIKKFTDAGMTQVNIHFMLAQETYEKAFEIAKDMQTDSRLAKMNAIVFLHYKHKNKNSPYHPVDDIDMYKRLVDFCLENRLKFGMDSCSAPLFMTSIRGHQDKAEMVKMVDPCESTCFSLYCNVDGVVFPCSFSEGVGEWEKGLDLLNAEDFMTGVWSHPRLVSWRTRLLGSSKSCTCQFSKVCRSCPIYTDINICKGVKYEVA